MLNIIILSFLLKYTVYGVEVKYATKKFLLTSNENIYLILKPSALVYFLKINIRFNFGLDVF